MRAKIYERMISERQQIAERFRSEGAGEAAKILGNKERDLREIESEAYKTIQKIRGEADAEATEIYAAAYNQSAESVELYEFIKSMETYRDDPGRPDHPDPLHRQRPLPVPQGHGRHAGP